MNSNKTGNMIAGKTNTFLKEPSSMYGANVYIFTYVLNVRETLNEKEPSTKA